jgi:tetratricopeptide (TPR) repeat protein
MTTMARPARHQESGRHYSWGDPVLFRTWLVLGGLAAGLLFFLGQAVFAQEPPSDWTGRVRALVSDGRLAQAKSIVDDWIKALPEDLDARGWHARLQAWTKHWKEAEVEYRAVLDCTPEDVDLLAGLADVLSSEGRNAEALALIERACTISPDRTDCGLRRAHILQQLGRTREARMAYQGILTKDAASVEAKKGLEQLRDAGRHEFRVGTDIDLLNNAENAGAFDVSIRSRWNNRWSSLASVNHYRRFGEPAWRGAADATLHISPEDTFTFGGAVAHDQGIVPRAEAKFEYGHGFRLSEDGPIRGIEALYQQWWLWYRDARVLALSPGVILYFPSDWNCLFRFSEYRVGFSGVGNDWKPSGWTRLTFPIRRSLSGYVLFAVGTENLGHIDQISHSSTRSWGTGLSVLVAPRQELRAYGQYYLRSGRQAQTSFGVNYAIRF